MIHYINILHYNKDSSDKVWGYFQRNVSQNIYTFPKNYCIFWGGVGKALQLKSVTERHYSSAELPSKARSKIDKGYKTITHSELLELWPNFDNDIEEKILREVLAGSIK
jgi:hypothetical protein